MGYLRYFDYQKTIQDANFQQIIASNDHFRVDTENAAQAEMISYLVQKYDVSREFMATSIWDFSLSYKANTLVELNFPAYNPAITYALNTLVTEAGKEYINITPITTPEAFTGSKWKLLGNQYDLFYIPYPYPVFDLKEFYNIGDKVFWKDKIYVCLIQTVLLTHDNAIQFGQISQIPHQNVFPDDKANGKQNWTAGVSYLSPAGLLPTNVAADFTPWSSITSYVTGNKVSSGAQIWQALVNNTDVTPGTDITKWQSIGYLKGDNRNQQMVMYMVDMVLFHLHSRIAPRNIPQLRLDRYRDAKEWLKDSAIGNITADLPIIQPAQGNRIRFGGDVKNENRY